MPLPCRERLATVNERRGISRLRRYTQDIESFVDTRSPPLNVSFHNAGVPGDRVTGGYAGDAATRVARDVAPFKPTVLTVMLGMNEGGYTSFSPEVLPAFISGYSRLIELLRDAAPGARITLLENSPYDEVTHGAQFAGYMDTTERIAKSTAEIAAHQKVEVIDTETPMKELLVSAARAEPKLAALLIRDRIHPGDTAHWVTAAMNKHLKRGKTGRMARASRPVVFRTRWMPHLQTPWPSKQ